VQDQDIDSRKIDLTSTKGVRGATRFFVLPIALTI
jgi:hypothetical protein